MSENPFPRLDDRARGWLRFIWDKATTPDDWSSAGEPHPWWDQSSTPPMCSLGRFDLHETGYVLPVMCDLTPAWREVYSRIGDGLVDRYRTFWSAIDWLTMIGHDPDQANYPPEWLIYMPEHLRGHYDAPGWPANGIEPWGLQPDPIGADGNNFFRGFFNLLLGFYRYVSGDVKWEQPFKVTGYRDLEFEWDQHRLVSFIHDQWAERPQGVHCENTKVWPFCVSGAGLGLHLYDGIHGTDNRWLFARWVDYAKQHFMGLDKRGGIDWFAFYYDPLEKSVMRLRDDISAYAAFCITPYVLPQDREFGTLLYESSMRTLGWDDPKKPLVQWHLDPRWAAVALMTAHELGDTTTEDRFRSLVEREFEPRFFGENDSRFGWWFNFGEDYPRGQLSSLMVLAELGEPGAWSRVFNQPNVVKFTEPTIEGVDFPDVGVAQAWNDPAEGVLWVETHTGTPSRRGDATAFRVTQLPDAKAATVAVDGTDHGGVRIVDDHVIEIDARVGDHIYRIVTGYRGSASTRAGGAGTSTGSGGAGGGTASITLAPPGTGPTTCGGGSCCGPL